MSVASLDDEAAELEQLAAGSSAVSVESSAGTAPSLRTPKAKAKSRALGMYANCNVCESTDMAPGMKQCKLHNRTVRNILASLEGDEEATKGFTQMRDAAPQHPPSQFASTVKEHEEKYPAPGRGKKRVNNKEQTAAVVQKHRKTTGVMSGTRCIKMHEEQWMHHRVELQRYPRAEAQALWDRVKQSIDQKFCDQGGPMHSKHRQPMPKEDYDDFYRDIGLDTELVVRDKKPQTVTGEQQLAEMQDEAMATGNISHTHSFFETQGASSASAFLLAGVGALGGPAGATDSNENVFAKKLEKAMQAEKDKEKEDTPKLKKKKVDLEALQARATEKFTVHLQKSATKLEQAAKAQADALEKAKNESGELRVGCHAGAVPGLERSMETMKSRFVLVEHLKANAEVPKKEVMETTMPLPKMLNDLDALIAVVPSDEADTPMTKEVMVKVGEAFTDELAADLLFSSFLKASGFKQQAASAKGFRTGLQKIRDHQARSEVLRDLLRGRVKSGKPLPFEAEDVERVQNLSFLEIVEHYGLAMQTTTEEEIKCIDDEVKVVLDLTTQLVDYAKKGAEELAGLVKRHDDRAKNKLENEKKAEKNKAKAVAKQKAKAAEKLESTVTNPATALFDANDPCIKPVPTYDNQEAFDTAKQDKSHAPQKPHFIKASPSLGDIVKDRTVKAALGIFRIQFPASAAKEQGGGQQPLRSEKTGQLREVLLQGACDPRTLPATWEGKPAQKIFEQVHMYARTSGHVPLCAWERQGLASCRYQEAGAREIIAISIPSLIEFVAEAGIERALGMTYKSFLEGIIAELHHSLDMFSSKGGEIFKGVMRAGSFCYMPFGYMVIERTLGDTHGYGFRAAALDATPAGVEALGQMQRELKAIAGDEDALVKLWATVIDAIG